MGIVTSKSTAPQLARSAYPPVPPRVGASRMFDAAILSGPQAAIVTNVLQSSTEYSITSNDLDGNSGRPEEGSGLGLHISQKLAALIGGRITFESVHGHGSSFTLSIEE